jgi:hypothetical protein
MIPRPAPKPATALVALKPENNPSASAAAGKAVRILWLRVSFHSQKRPGLAAPKGCLKDRLAARKFRKNVIEVTF